MNANLPAAAAVVNTSIHHPRYGITTNSTTSHQVNFGVNEGNACFSPASQLGLQFDKFDLFYSFCSIIHPYFWYSRLGPFAAANLLSNPPLLTDAALQMVITPSTQVRIRARDSHLIVISITQLRRTNICNAIESRTIALFILHT